MDETLGKLIQRRLNELKMSKAELARRIGKSPAYVGDLANDTAKTKSGTYVPSAEVVDALAYHLQISREEILVTLGIAVKKNECVNLAPHSKKKIPMITINNADFFGVGDRLRGQFSGAGFGILFGRFKQDIFD